MKQDKSNMKIVHNELCLYTGLRWGLIVGKAACMCLMVQRETHLRLLNKKWGSSWNCCEVRAIISLQVKHKCMLYFVSLYLSLFSSVTKFWLLSLLPCLLRGCLCINISMEMVRPKTFQFSQQQNSIYMIILDIIKSI